MKRANLSVESAVLWGFPFFTLQKHLADLNFKGVRDTYLTGKMTRLKRWVFSGSYWAFFVHDLFNAGTQIYLVARKT